MTIPETEPAVSPADRLARAIAVARDTLPKASAAVRTIDAALEEYEPFIRDFGETAQEVVEADDPRQALGVVPAYTRFIGGQLDSVEAAFAMATEHLDAGSGAVAEARQALAELRARPEARPRAWDVDKLGARVEHLGDAYDEAREVLADARNRLTSSRDLLARETDVELGHTGNEVTLARANAGSAAVESADLAKWLQTAPAGISTAASATAAASEQDLRHRQGKASGPQGQTR
jgi:hypothetical protein